MVHGQAAQAALGVSSQGAPHAPGAVLLLGAPHHAQVAQVDAAVQAGAHRLVGLAPRLQGHPDLCTQGLGFNAWCGSMLGAQDAWWVRLSLSLQVALCVCFCAIFHQWRPGSRAWPICVPGV